MISLGAECDSRRSQHCQSRERKAMKGERADTGCKENPPETVVLNGRTDEDLARF